MSAKGVNIYAYGCTHACQNNWANFMLLMDFVADSSRFIASMRSNYSTNNATHLIYLVKILIQCISNTTYAIKAKTYTVKMANDETQLPRRAQRLGKFTSLKLKRNSI